MSTIIHYSHLKLSIKKSILAILLMSFVVMMPESAAGQSNVKERARAFFGDNVDQYATSLSILAVMNYKLGKYHDALALQQQAVDLTGENGMNMTILGLFYHNVGDDETALEVLTKAEELYKQEIPVPSNALDVLTIFYASINDVEHTNRFIENSVNQLKSFIITTVTSETVKDDRKRFWLKFEQVFNSLLLEWEYNVSRENNTALLYDNAALFAKGLMLNVENSVKSHDESRLNLSWKDIKRHLGDEDIAIEFVAFPVGSDSTMYAAITVKNDYDKPLFTPLFEQRQLQDIKDNDYYVTGLISELVWEPLAAELHDVNNIYFSPVGALHNIAIELVPSTVIAGMHMHRLSSTREIMAHNNYETLNNFTLYGGLDYIVSSDTIMAVNKKSGYSRSNSEFAMRAEFRLKDRDYFGYLEGSLKEVDSIQQILREKNTTKLTEEKGTEESFKALKGANVQVLHLATHGKYVSRQEAIKELTRQNYKFIMLDSLDNSLLSEDYDLTRAFIVMSGGQSLSQMSNLPTNLDDGMLTAQEISQMQFNDLQLVVLSACETALGDINSEGVMGLQRGFKKAGAKAIIMTLWKVDDNATYLLMTEFYRNLAKGDNIATAFENARNHLRSIEKYSSYKYWAPFILLDAI
ncbi:MAG: CHAT domain-containing protein [Muribaculaceae bacterium]|nr:CHAT domain-containing protein [Muribaculaceae bacterium]